jgi:diadenosine tetraphosphate (Ap4A) HIT family hydrolase
MQPKAHSLMTTVPKIREAHAYTNSHFRVEPCVSCPIAGYLIVSPRVPAFSLSQFSSDTQASLGATLAASTRAIELVIRPERVYCLLFAEEACAVHFHLFPRTSWLLSEYRRAYPRDGQVSGPRLLDWAGQTFRSPVSDDYEQTTQAILREIGRNT